MTEDKLTNEEIAKAFAMYLPCPVKSAFVGNNQMLTGIYKERTPEDYYDISAQIEFHVNGRHDIRPINPKSVQLLLTDLKDITDEHKFEIYGMGFTHVVNERLQIMPIYKWPNMRADQHQQLMNWGYAVKLYFGINHWANNKTAIELQIAISK